MATVKQVWTPGRVTLWEGQAVPQNGTATTSYIDLESLQCCGVLLSMTLGCSGASDGHWEVHACAQDAISIIDGYPTLADDDIGTPWLSVSFPAQSQLSVTDKISKNLFLPQPLPPKFTVHVRNRVGSTETQFVSLYYRTFNWQVV